MVGFGSSLRMGRRTGWESAYLDYETLKLFLSQIEAVYEERDLGTGASADGFFMSNGIADSERNMSANTNEQSGPKTTNYRDELFLESNSDLAFASEMDVNSADDDDSDEYGNRDIDMDRVMLDESFDYNYTGLTVWEQQGLGQHHMHVDPTETQSGLSSTTPSAFSVSAFPSTKGSVYSSSSDEDAQDNNRGSSSKKSGIRSMIGRRTSKKNRHHAANRANSTSIQDAFIVEKGTFGSDYYDDEANRGDDGGSGKNYFYYKFTGNDYDDNEGGGVNTGGGSNNYSVFRNVGGRESNFDSGAVREGSPLLGGASPASKEYKANFVSFPTPGRVTNHSSITDGYGSLINPNANTTTSSTKTLSTTSAGAALKESKASSFNKKDEKKARYERERRYERKQRRRRRLIRQRKEREKRVPPHIRIAHEKSRAITERFLGLLRAEVEKVTLFAQARLGELADTAGSLRFLSSDENVGMYSANTASYEYPLSDGGIHPSASSSSDEGAGGGYHSNNKGAFPWSDSSSEDEIGSKASQSARLDIAKTFSSADGYSARTDHRENLTEPSVFSAFRSKTKQAPEVRRPGRPTFTETQEKFEATTRKIAHFQEIRRERSIFQRNDDIVGEDLLLISAVDEADAFSAVGVELLHILKYICVNLIAVRKICKKHDRLLMNRMLGGYYHRKRTTRSQEDTTLGGLIAHVAGDIYEAHPDLIGVVNNGKLIGIYDSKIQQLANSRTVKVVSSCLALALSEYEVSRSRADALGKLNPTKKKGKKSPATFQEQTSGNWTFSLGADNCLKQPNEKPQLLQDPDVYFGSDDERSGGPPSTTSALSLSRLRYTVLSIAALREASRIKSNPFSSYLSRSSLMFTGYAVVGEGLDGCSRETLDVLLAYNPDAALLLDTSAIYEGLKCGQWQKASITSVMTSSLAVALSLPSSGQSSAPITIPPRVLHEKEFAVSNALGIMPRKSEEIDAKSPLDGAGLPASIFLRISRFTNIPPSLLRANRFALFLYNANYFIAHPTSVTLVLDSDENIAYSALVIGAPTLGAILISMLQCHIISGYPTRMEPNAEKISMFRFLLIFSCLSAVIGNVVQIYGIENTSIKFTILGRFLLGFSAVEIVNRQFVVSFLPTCLIVAESARLVQFQVSGQLLGLLIGSSAGSFVQTTSELNLTSPAIVVKNNTSSTSGTRRRLYNSEARYNISALSHNSTQFQADITSTPEFLTGEKEPLWELSTSDAVASSDSIVDSLDKQGYILPRNSYLSRNLETLDEIDYNQVDRLTAANWSMVSLWLIYLLYFIFGPYFIKARRAKKKQETDESQALDERINANESIHSTDSSLSDQETGRATLLQNSSTFRDGSVEKSFVDGDSVTSPEITTGRRKRDMSRSPKRKRRPKIRTFSKRIRKLMTYSIAIPVSLVFIIWTVFAQEVLFSSCALITKSYFLWRGSFTGVFLASLWVLLLPMDYFCERLARRYEERFTVRQSILFLGLGLLVMFNWGSFFALIPNIKNLLKEDRSNRHHHYDWMLGVGQYIVGFIITFASLRALSIGSRSLLSKVSPPNLTNVVVNFGTIVTFITLFSQMFANFYISSIVLSHREINSDILNSLLMPSLIATFVMYYLVRKHYFFLM